MNRGHYERGRAGAPECLGGRRGLGTRGAELVSSAATPVKPRRASAGTARTPSRRKRTREPVGRAWTGALHHPIIPSSMATFMVNGPPSAPHMAVGAAFYGSEDGAVEDAMDDVEMDTDHFNELDKIFDLPYPADGNDPFAPPQGGRAGAAAGAGSGATEGRASAGTNVAASMMVQPPYLQTHRMDWSSHSSHGPHREEEASYHTAVDATRHSSAVDASYHHTVDGSTHSHSVVDASIHSHSVMDASGHDSLADYSQHEEYDYGGKEPRYMEHSCEACKRSKVRAPTIDRSIDGRMTG